MEDVTTRQSLYRCRSYYYKNEVDGAFWRRYQGKVFCNLSYTSKDFAAMFFHMSPNKKNIVENITDREFS